MRTLNDAWQWYQATRRSLLQMKRLGEKHWNDLSLNNDSSSIWRDEWFKTLDAPEIVADAESSLKPIEDLAVVVMFSVFESHVRDYLLRIVETQANKIVDPILKEAAESAIQGIKDGSFYRRVLEPLKNQDPTLADLISQVNQVRDYRNWVAHGRRETPKNNITPKTAFDRLSLFLDRLGIATESEEPTESN